MIKPAMQRGDASDKEDLNKQQILDAINFIKGEVGNKGAL
jgi:hypothetical protein